MQIEFLMLVLFESYQYGCRRVNYVDDHNRFVGFVTEQQCCELCECFVIDTSGFRVRAHKSGIDVSCWSDLHFAPEAPVLDDGAEVGKLLDECYHCKDSGGMARFKLLNEDEKHVAWLVLVNSHNGWYTHMGEYHMGKGTDFCL